MNKIQCIALRIALIQEEYSDAEIKKAIKLLQSKGITTILTDYLSGNSIEASTSNVKPKLTARKQAPVSEQHSKAIRDLVGVDDEKHSLLLEFDSLVRKGEVLQKLEDIRRLGERLDKDFANPRSRREAIGRLMTVIARLPIDDIKDIINSSISLSVSSNSDYRDLAEFIIEGKHKSS